MKTHRRVPSSNTQVAFPTQAAALLMTVNEAVKEVRISESATSISTPDPQPKERKRVVSFSETIIYTEYNEDSPPCSERKRRLTSLSHEGLNTVTAVETTSDQSLDQSMSDLAPGQRRRSASDDDLRAKKKMKFKRKVVPVMTALHLFRAKRASGLSMNAISEEPTPLPAKLPFKIKSAIMEADEEVETAPESEKKPCDSGYSSNEVVNSNGPDEVDIQPMPMRAIGPRRSSIQIMMDLLAKGLSRMKTSDNLD